MTEELSGRRIVVPETRELGQLIRMLEEYGAEAIPCPMIAIRDAPDVKPVEAWLGRFVNGACDDLVLMTGEGLRRLLGFARRADLESAFLNVLRTTRKITRGPKPVRALREIGLNADIPADEPTTEGIIAALRRIDLGGRSIGVQLNPGNPNLRLLDFIEAAGAVPDPVLPYGRRPVRRDRIYERSSGSTASRCSPRYGPRVRLASRLQANCSGSRGPDRRVRA